MKKTKQNKAKNFSFLPLLDEEEKFSYLPFSVLLSLFSFLLFPFLFFSSYLLFFVFKSDLFCEGSFKPRGGHDAGDHPPITPMTADRGIKDKGKREKEKRKRETNKKTNRNEKTLFTGMRKSGFLLPFSFILFFSLR